MPRVVARVIWTHLWRDKQWLYIYKCVFTYKLARLHSGTLIIWTSFIQIVSSYGNTLDIMHVLVLAQILLAVNCCDAHVKKKLFYSDTYTLKKEKKISTSRGVTRIVTDRRQ